jgi:hypothetical protein
MTAGARRVFIRLGEVPDSGRSQNHEDGHCEAGVSCYEADMRGGTIWIRSDGLDLEATRNKLAEARRQRRALFLVVGRVHGKGSDGEPVLLPESIEPLRGYSIEQVRVAGS